MPRFRHLLRGFLLLLIVAVLATAATLRLQQIALSGKPNAQDVVSAATGVATVIQTVTVTPGPPGTATPNSTVDPYVLTLTAAPTFPPFPTSLLTPNPLNPEGTPNTPTPDLYAVTTPTIEYPPTLPAGKTVDLTNGTPVPPEQMIIFTVYRANGTYDEYHIPPWLMQNPTEDYLNQLMEIQLGDKILGWMSGDPLRKLATSTPALEATSTP